jgi:hypothetical protein
MKYIITFTLLILFLSACAAPVAPAPTAAPPTPAPPTLALTATPFAPISAKELNALIADITAKMQQAVASADPIAKIQFEASERAQSAAEMFARSLTDAENPADRVLDPKSFSIGISPDGIAYLRLEVDSVWGKAHEVAIIDTGTDKAMFVTLAGAGLDKGQLLLNEKGYYAVVKDESGTIIAAIDPSRQWTTNLAEASKLPEVDVSKQMAMNYVDGKHEIDFNNLSHEEYEKISIAITEELNNRIEAPPHFLENGQVTYIDQQTGEQLTISSTEFNKRKAELAPNSFIPAKQDEDGTWMYLDEESKQYVRIEGSAGFDFSSVVDENNMDAGIIKWPTTEKLGNKPHYEGPYPDLTFAQMILKDLYDGLYIPVVLVNNQATSIPAQSSDNGNFTTYRKGLEFLVKRAYGFEKIHITFAADMIIFQEEDSSKEKNILYSSETDGAKKQIKEELIEDQIYFLGLRNKQADVFKSGNRITIDNIGGAIPAKDSVTALTNDQSKENKLIIAIADILIRHK